MPRKGQTKRKPSIGDTRDPDSLTAHMLRFSQWQREKAYSERTVENREAALRPFIAWCAERGLTSPREITKPILERYQRHLFLYRKADGEPLSVRSQHVRTTPIKALFKWLSRGNHILYNPASELELPRMEKRLPRHVLSAREVEKVMAIPDIATPIGLRDRAMLEVFYSTGIRRMELINLHLTDIDADRGTLMVRQGKGRKDRMVPIGERALAWTQKYREDVRGDFASGSDAVGGDGGTLFLTTLGEAFAPGRMTQLVRGYVTAADLGKRGSCHLFRHSMATLMLENGADIRFIQAMLGHAELSTTQIYTQVSIRMLKQIHSATHPGRPIAARRRQHDAGDDRETLLAVLDAEADEEEA
jgi:integrase/recombinase XerD